MTYADLVAKAFSPEQVPRVVAAIAGVVEGSFEARGGPRTGAEEKRRVELACDIVVHLRGDLGWSVDRILDNLAPYLCARLDGGPFDPERARPIWVPGSGR